MIRVKEGFGRMAADYDAQDRANPILQWMRTVVRAAYLRHFKPGDAVLEINCGTGEDAVFLARQGIRVLATDISDRMIEVLRSKAKAEGLERLIEAKVLAIEDLAQLGRVHFDGAYSNFGGINCVRDLGKASRDLAALLRPGAGFVSSVINRFCALETLLYLRQGQWAKAVRRWNPRGTFANVADVKIVEYCHSPSTFARAFSEDFILDGRRGLGVFIPPPYAQSFYQKHPRLMNWLHRYEQGLSARFPFYNLGDHFLVELLRRLEP